MKTRSLWVVAAMLFTINIARSAPVLSSLPTANATLYLDFDGHDVQAGTFWNNGVPFTCLPAAMTDAQVTEAFNRVAEDFRPFNINITTDINRYLAAPLSMRIRIVVTPTSSWYPGVAGIAYTNSFTWGDDTPAFVFSDRLNNDAKKVAEAVSHESGHTLGLSHQSSYTSSCTLNYTYNPGSGIGQTSWGPIMGSASSMNTTQWNFGPTPKGCTIKEDNLAIITTNNGFGYRADDYANAYTSALPVSITSNIFTRTGIISTTADKDLLRFDLGQNGKFSLKAMPYGVGPNNNGANLDIRISLLNANGSTIANYDYTDSLHAAMDTTLNAGTYYIMIDGAGNVNSVNDYGSLGAYTLDGYYSGTTTTTSTTTTTTPKTTTGGKKRSSNSSISIIPEGDETSLNKPFIVIKPSQQPVMVKSTTSYTYQIVDNFGRIIMVGKADAGTKTLDIRNHPAGIYNLRLMGSGTQQTEQFFNR
jgi:hypothetical protein